MVQEMLAFWTLTLLSLLATNTQSLRYDPEQVDFNLNQNKTASDPLDYGGGKQRKLSSLYRIFCF